MTGKPRSTAKANTAALIVVVVIVGTLLWIGQAIIARNRVQNCIDSGRRDCLPVPGAE